MRDPEVKKYRGKPCPRTSLGRHTSRRVILEALIGLGATSALYGSLDSGAWRAYEAVEEAWIRDRHELLLQSAPDLAESAELDLEAKLTDLKRRAVQFRHLLGCDPGVLRGGVWQLTALPVSTQEDCDPSTTPEFRKLDEKLRQLTDSLRQHPQHSAFQRAQMRLWKTPQYRDIHRRYMGRMQELQRLYGGSSAATAVKESSESH